MDDDIDCDTVCVGVAVGVKPVVTVWVGETDGLVV